MTSRVFGRILVFFAGSLMAISATLALATAVTAQSAADLSAHGRSSLGGTVTREDGSPVPDVTVDYFDANADGSRSRWLGDETTAANGTFRRTIKPGCYVLVFIAPTGETFINGGKYREIPTCIKPNEAATINATLAGRPPGCFIDGTTVDTVLVQEECDALLALYTATNGPNWQHNTGWNTPTDPCTWFGTTCEQSEFRQLRLTDNQLSGTIPVDLFQLPNLQELSLGFNNLAGTVPIELVQLTELTFLQLGPAQLTGPIPAELGRLDNLEVLLLEGNKLSGPIPPELGALKNLRFLGLSGNFELSGPIPIQLGQLTNLEGLSLGATGLSGPIPPELGTLTELRLLQLSGIGLTGPIPPELGRLTKLTLLTLDSNQLSGSIPAELGQLSSLITIRLEDNRLTGDITDAMSGFRDQSALRFLTLSDGPGGNNCFTVSDPELADWLSARDTNWAECD